MNKLLFLLFISFSTFSFSQNKKIDQLEVYYAQAHYSKVLRKSKKLLASPDYDYSGLPLFYKSLALFRMNDDLTWFKRHKSSINEAISLYNSFLEFSNTEYYLIAHQDEIANLKTYLTGLKNRLFDVDYKSEAKIIDGFINKQLKNIKGNYVKPSNSIHPNESASISLSGSVRNDIVKYAEKYIGTPYVWAGNTPNGFDCSGYTSYVFKEFNVEVPRTASDQKANSKKIITANAKKGDLVFFGKGNSVTHVGIVVSEKGEPLTMIHSSTSRGIIITNIETSTYWMPKLKGVGSVIK